MQLYEFFNNIEQRYNVETLKNSFNEALPIPHVIIDNFFPDDIFKDLCNDIKNYPQEKWIVKNLGTSSIRKEARDFTESPILNQILTNLTAHSFVTWMGKITNNSSIIPDPHHLGAGLTSTPSGTNLGLHVDFNWNDTLKLNRKFNLILYANESWDDNWNGHLEFWNKESTECLYTVRPSPNRLIFWEYEQDLIHGFTKPINCPPEVERQNLMTIYYTSNSTPISPPHKSKFY
jgi:Rps23 Pro-64 3,4-dihydroxylase Tpa1-like proline 4-hydroxylase